MVPSRIVAPAKVAARCGRGFRSRAAAATTKTPWRPCRKTDWLPARSSTEKNGRKWPGSRRTCPFTTNATTISLHASSRFGGMAVPVTRSGFHDTDAGAAPALAMRPPPRALGMAVQPVGQGDVDAVARPVRALVLLDVVDDVLRGEVPDAVGCEVVAAAHPGGRQVVAVDGCRQPVLDDVVVGRPGEVAGRPQMLVGHQADLDRQHRKSEGDRRPAQEPSAGPHRAAPPRTATGIAPGAAGSPPRRSARGCRRSGRRASRRSSPRSGSPRRSGRWWPAGTRPPAWPPPR